MSNAVPLPPSSPASRSSPRRRWWLLGLVGCAAPLSCLAGVVVLGFLSVQGARELPVTETDRALLVTAEVTNGIATPLEVEAHREQLTKRLDPQRTLELSYTYDGSDVGRFVQTTVTVSRSVPDAVVQHGGMRYGLTGYLAVTSDLVAERREWMRWGDDSETSLLLMDGTPVGVFFAGRKGKKTFALMLSGLAVDQETLERLLRPRLEALERYPDVR